MRTRYRGKLLRADQVVLELVFGLLEERQRANGSVHWEGTLNLPRGRVLRDGEQLMLQLADGRAGAVRIDGAAYGDGGGVALFRGQGPLV
jgi:hypothetical protein